MLEELLKDWFGERNQTTFVHNSKDAIGWSDKYKYGGVSQYLTGKQAVLDVLKTAYRLAKNRCTAMLPGRYVPLYLTGDESFTNGKVIVVATEVADEKTLSANERIDIILGLTTHEVAHLLHTDFDKKFIINDFQHTIHNIIEDERIEYHTCVDNPGYSAFLEPTKNYYFDFKHTKKDFATPGKEAFDCFFKLVRYPKYVDIDAVERHAEFLMKVKEVLTPYPLGFIECFEASVKIANLFESYFEENFRKPKKEKGKGQQGKEDKSNDPSSESDSSETKEENKADDNKSGEDNANGGGEKDQDSSNGGSPSENGDEDEEVDEMEVQIAVKELLDELCGLMDDIKSTSQNPAMVKASDVFEKIPLAKEIIYGEAEFIGESSTYFVKAQNSKDNYAQKKTKTFSAAMSLAKVIAIDKTESPNVVNNMRSGQLDTGKIVDAWIGSANVYTQQEDRLKKSIDVVLMIDQSGSMSGRSNKYSLTSKIEDASMVAVLFNEALKHVKDANLYVYGFTSDHDALSTDTITIYKEKGFNNSTAIGSIASQSNNRDGKCIRAVVDRCLKNGIAKNKLLFVVSDGQPHGYNYMNMPAISDTRDAVRYAASKGFVPIQVGIGVNEHVQALMFDQYVNYQSSQQMVTEISKLLRKKMQVFSLA